MRPGETEMRPRETEMRPRPPLPAVPSRLQRASPLPAYPAFRTTRRGRPPPQIFALKAGTWAPAGTAPDLPSPRAGAFTTPRGDAVFLAVGEGGGTAHTAVEALAWDARRGSWVWSALPPVPASRAGSGAAACGADDAAVYVAGSSGRQGGGEPLRLSLQALTPDGRQLRACSSSGAPTAAPTAAAGGDAACFPVDATVTVVGRGAVRLADVGRGDVLAVASVRGGVSTSPCCCGPTPTRPRGGWRSWP